MLPTWPRFFLHLGCFCLVNILSQVHNKRLNVQYCQNISNEQKLFNVGYIHGLKKFADCQNGEY